MIVEEALEMDYVTRAMNNGILSRCSFFFLCKRFIFEVISYGMLEISFKSRYN